MNKKFNPVLFFWTEKVIFELFLYLQKENSFSTIPSNKSHKLESKYS